MAYKINSDGVEKVLIEWIFLVDNFKRENQILTAYLNKRQDFPTPEFPINNNLKR